MRVAISFLAVWNIAFGSPAVPFTVREARKRADGVFSGALVDHFNTVQLDSEIHKLVWLNGADYNPATLHEWPENESAFTKLASKWETVRT
jgi:hypothetical protein